MKRLILSAIIASGVIAGAVVAPAQASVLRPSQVTLHPCTDPTSQTSDPQGHLGPYGKWVVSADVWNDVNISQTVYGCNHNSWYATEQASGTAVQAYPDTNWTPGSSQPIGEFASLTQAFGCQVPTSTTGFIGECADDLYLGGSTQWSGKSSEVMLWTWNHRQVPAGSVVATVTLSGITWQVWYGTDSAGDIITYEATSNVTSGDLDLLSILNDAQTRGYLGFGANVWQYGFGWEICQALAGTTIGVDAFNVKSEMG